MKKRNDLSSESHHPLILLYLYSLSSPWESSACGPLAPLPIKKIPVATPRHAQNFALRPPVKRVACYLLAP